MKPQLDELKNLNINVYSNANAKKTSDARKDGRKQVGAYFWLSLCLPRHSNFAVVALATFNWTAHHRSQWWNRV